MNMKAYEMGPQNGLDSLHFVERDMPDLGADEILVKVHAACLNHRDLLSLNGMYGAKKPENRIMLSDGVGTIADIGSDVTGLSKGQRIVAPHFCSWIDGEFSPTIFGNDIGMTRDGWLAEYIAVPANAAVVVPDSINNDTAAALSAAGITAWHCLVAFGGLQKDDVMLTLGTGGVSIFALQIAKAMGAKVAITSSSDDKLDICKKMGADFTVNYREHSNWAEKLIEATNGAGADVIVDTAGLVSIEQTIASAAPNGRMALIGGLAGQLDSPPQMMGMIGKNLTMKGVTSGSRVMMADLIDLFEKANIDAVIDKKFSFENAGDAFAYLHQGGHMGKVMIEI